MEMRRGLFWLVTCLVVFETDGQVVLLKDTMVLATIENPFNQGVSPLKYRLTQDLEYSISFSSLLFLNWQRVSGDNQAALFQHIKYKTKLDDTRKFTISTSFVHNLGIQVFFDSISRFQPDENVMDTRFDIRIKKNLCLTVLSNVSTRLFNAYDYSSDSTGDLMQTLRAAFLTPLLCTFSAGLGWTVPRYGTLTLGLSAAKLTLIRNKEVYDALGIPDFYGVPRNRSQSFEYGLSLHLIVDKKFPGRFHWTCDALVFKNYKKPIDVAIKNLIWIRINKFLKTSIQTRLLYEEQVSKCLQVENLITIGFFYTP